MDTRRQAEELVSRCVALVIFYHHLGKARASKAAMAAEIVTVLEDARKAGLSPETISSGVWRELYQRFERDTAVRLHAQFAEVFGLPPEISPVSA